MPEDVEEKLSQEAATKNLRGKAAKGYIFGTMNEKGLLRKKPKYTGGAPYDRGGNQDGD